jgi:hypothetical protein
MGYMGLNNYDESDLATDMYEDIERAITKAIRESFKRHRKVNEFNTNSAVNLALIIKSGILKNYNNSSIEDILDMAIEDIDKLINESSRKNKHEWDNEKNRENHYRKYKKLKNILVKYINTI